MYNNAQLIHRGNATNVSHACFCYLCFCFSHISIHRYNGDNVA